jgi:glucose-6-phosphate dehydrogenase assembly protein OpcA
VIVTLPDTTTSAIDRKLTEIRHAGGAIALGRVLTLIISTTTDECEPAIEAANDASSEHPCRVIVLIAGDKRESARLDAEIRVGGDAGASEVVLMKLSGPLASHAESVALPLLLPDAPVVAWWPDDAPDVVGEDPIGRMAQRRITDAATRSKPLVELTKRRNGYTPGDSDLAWTRLTSWRTLLAASLDQPPYDKVVSARVAGEGSSPSTELLAAWLADKLRCPVVRETNPGPGIVSVVLERRSGAVEMVRPDGRIATLTQPGQPARRIALPRRKLNECLAEELRRLDPDEVYEDVLRKGLARLDEGPRTGSSRATARKLASAKQETTASERRASSITVGRSGSQAKKSAPKK